MKKFLTVLLALSVVFTYTVGTAFAAAAITAPDAKDQLTSEKALKAVNDAYGEAKTDLLKAKTEALTDIFGKDSTKKIGDETVSKDAVDAVYNVTYNKGLRQADVEYQNMVNEIQKGISAGADYFYISTTDDAMATIDGVKYYPINTTFSLKDSAAGSAIDKAVYAALFKVDSGAFAGTAKDKVAQEQAKLVKEAALKDIRAIDLTVYSKEYNNATKSNYDLASDLVSAAIAEISKLTVSDSTEWADVFTASTGIIAKVAEIYTAPQNQQKAAGKLYTGGLLANPYDAIGLAKLDTISDAPSAEAKLAWAKTQVLDALNAKIGAWSKTTVDTQNGIILDETLKGSKGDATKIANAKTAIEETKAQAAAAVETATYLVNNTKKLSDLVKEDTTKFSQSKVLVGEMVNNQPDYDAEYKWNFKAGVLNAPTAKATYSATELAAISKHVAELKQDAENKKASVMIDGAEYVAIEKALEDAIDDCYIKGDTTNTLNVGDATKALWNRIADLVDGTAVTVNSRKYNSVSKWYSESLYEKEYYDKARAEVKAATEAIKSAKTVEEADAAFLAGFEKFSAVPSIASKNAAQATKEFSDLKKQYDNDIEAYVDYKVTSLKNAGLTDKYSWVPDTLKGALKAELAKAYTVDELKAKFIEAKVVVDGLKTQAELAEAKKALDTRIAALPATVTVTDKETVGTLKKDLEAHNDYCDTIGNIAQKVIIKASVENAYNKIKVAEADAIKDAIKAIGTVTVDDKAAIKAVRDQLDAYVNYYAGENATNAEITALEDISYNNTTVADLEKALDTAEVNAFKVMVGKLPADGSDVAGIKAARAAYDAMSLNAKIKVYRTSEYDKLVDLEKIAAKSVEALKITASSKAGKGYIKVTWKVKGSAATADGFQVYRSVKKNSGFGTKPYFTTKAGATSYKNTKSLKKGTRYYYKVRAYKVVDGKKVYSDWSNKAYRIAK